MNITPELVRQSIIPKSDQLNADDLIAGPRIVTIASVTQGSTDQPWNIKINEDTRVFRPCKTMRRVIVACWGDDSRKWIGKQMRLVLDPAVMFGGAKVGGIRIDALSDINGTQELSLTVTRGRKALFTIQELSREQPSVIFDTSALADAADEAHDAGADQWKAFLDGLKTSAEKSFVKGHAEMRRREGKW